MFCPSPACLKELKPEPTRVYFIYKKMYFKTIWIVVELVCSHVAFEIVSFLTLRSFHISFFFLTVGWHCASASLLLSPCLSHLLNRPSYKIWAHPTTKNKGPTLAKSGWAGFGLGPTLCTSNPKYDHSQLSLVARWTSEHRLWYHREIWETTLHSRKSLYITHNLVHLYYHITNNSNIQKSLTNQLTSWL